MAINVNTGFAVGSKAAIDERFVFETLAEMKAYDENLIPDAYFAVNKEDGQLYVYNTNNETDATTGKWRVVSGSGEGQEADTYYVHNIEFNEPSVVSQWKCHMILPIKEPLTITTLKDWLQVSGYTDINHPFVVSSSILLYTGNNNTGTIKDKLWISTSSNVSQINYYQLTKFTDYVREAKFIETANNNIRTVELAEEFEFITKANVMVQYVGEDTDTIKNGDIVLSRLTADETLEWVKVNGSSNLIVEANPEEEATETLEKIKIDDTVYEIPSSESIIDVDTLPTEDIKDNTLYRIPDGDTKTKLTMKAVSVEEGVKQPSLHLDNLMLPKYDSVNDLPVSYLASDYIAWDAESEIQLGFLIVGNKLFFSSGAPEQTLGRDDVRDFVEFLGIVSTPDMPVYHEDYTKASDIPSDDEIVPSPTEPNTVTYYIALESIADPTSGYELKHHKGDQWYTIGGKGKDADPAIIDVDALPEEEVKDESLYRIIEKGSIGYGTALLREITFVGGHADPFDLNLTNVPIYASMSDVPESISVDDPDLEKYYVEEASVLYCIVNGRLYSVDASRLSSIRRSDIEDLFANNKYYIEEAGATYKLITYATLAEVPADAPEILTPDYSMLDLFAYEGSEATVGQVKLYHHKDDSWYAVGEETKSDPAIIDVEELPTSDIKDESFYRAMGKATHNFKLISLEFRDGRPYGETTRVEITGIKEYATKDDIPRVSLGMIDSAEALSYVDGHDWGYCLIGGELFFTTDSKGTPIWASDIYNYKQVIEGWDEPDDRYYTVQYDSIAEIPFEDDITPIADDCWGSFWAIDTIDGDYNIYHHKGDNWYNMSTGGSPTPEMTFTETTPVPQTLGGVAEGTTFDHMPITDVLHMLLYPYIPFTATFSATAAGGTFEYGTSKTISKFTITATPNSSTMNNVVITSDDLNLDLAFEGNTTIEHTLTDSIVLDGTSDYTISYEINGERAQDKKTGTVKYSFTKEIYYAVSNSATSIPTSGTKGNDVNITVGDGQYIYFLSPTAKTKIQQYALGQWNDVDTESMGDVDFTLGSGATVTYKAYRSPELTALTGKFKLV